MIFALLFIAVFLISVVVYVATRRWVVAVVVPMVLFILSTLLDVDAAAAQSITLIFGLPIVFFASLLGAYVVELRTPDRAEAEVEEESSEAS